MESVEALCDHISLINHSQKVIEGKVTDIQHQFKENLYEINLRTEPDKIPDINAWGYQINSTNRQNDGTVTLRFMTEKNNTSNDILQHFMPIGQVNSFKEVLPSINDVFIKLVKGESK